MTRRKKIKKPDRKARPRNEITEQEVEEFLSAIHNFDGDSDYPKLRDLRKLLPSMDPYKVNVILRYLERSKAIIVDNDGYIIWTRKEGAPDRLTLADVANISDDLKEFLEKDKEGEEKDDDGEEES